MGYSQSSIWLHGQRSMLQNQQPRLSLHWPLHPVSTLKCVCNIFLKPTCVLCMPCLYVGLADLMAGFELCASPACHLGGAHFMCVRRASRTASAGNYQAIRGCRLLSEPLPLPISSAGKQLQRISTGLLLQKIPLTFSTSPHLSSRVCLFLLPAFVPSLTSAFCTSTLSDFFHLVP